MTDSKKYIINVGDQSEEWTSDMYAQKGDSLFAKYKDAEVFEVEDSADFDEDPTDHQYIINVGDDSEVWDGDMVKEKGTKLKEAYPDVKIQRVSYKDYWGEQATANRERRKALEQPDAERNARLASIGYYDDITGGQGGFSMDTNLGYGLKPLSSAIETNSVSGETTYLDPRVQEFFVNDTAETERQAEIARLDAEYENNPAVIAQREWEAQWRADQAKYNDQLTEQIKKDAEADGVGDAQRRQNRKMAPMLGMGNPMAVAQYHAMYADAELPTTQSENYASALNMMERIKELERVSEKGFGGALLDVAREKFDSWREPDLVLYNKIGDILTNLESKLNEKGLVSENLTPEVLEQHLSNDEKALILSFFQYNSALADAQQDMSAWYKGGKIFGESIPFMLEFLATGGLYKAAGSAATKGMAGALKKWVLSAAKGSVKRTLRKGAAVALRNLAYAGVGTLARTAVAPGTYSKMAEESVKIEDGHLDRTKNVFKSFADSYIENLSEISGGLIGRGLGLLGKGIGKAASMSGIPFSKLGNMLADNKLMQTIAAGWKSVAPKFEALGFHGIFEEIGEEYIGNAIREFTIQPGALAEMHKDDNFGAMLIGFAPMTLFGGAMSAVSIGAKNIEAANLGKKLRETLGQHYSEDQIDHMMNLVSGAENSKDVWEAIKPLTVGLNAKEAQQLFQYGAFMAQNKAMLFAKKAQDDNLAQAKRAELQQTYNKFWQQNAEGAESVQIATLNDGRTVFVVSEPTAEGVVSIIDAASGAKGFTNVSNYKTQEVDGAATPMTQTWSMDAYLEAEIASERRTSEQARMEREYNEQVQNLQSQIQEGTKINLGTEGNPVIMLATGKFVKDGVVAVDQAGNTHTIGWNQVADAMNQPIRVKTDQQLIDEEMAAIVARNAERRKRMTDADPAMTDAVNESAAQSAEVVAQENRHIPMNEDGTVNEAAFWEQDPEGYVQWNDEQNQDGGADSLQQVAITKAVLTSLLAEAQQAQQTSNPAERKAAKQRAQEIAEKINRLTAIEAGYAEQRIAPLRERAMKWKSLTNAPVYIVETEEYLASISGQAAASNKGGARVRGFAKDGRAYIYLPGIVEESEIDAVFMHEAVAHTGLKGLLGQQAFDELCDQVWEMMSPEMQTVFINYPGVNGNTRAAADEYIAHLAETMGAGIAEAEEKTIWQSIIDFVRNILRSMGIALNVSESELSDLLHMAYADLAKNLDEAEKIAQQNAERKEAVGAAPTTARQMYDAYIKEGLTPEEVSQGVQNDFKAAKDGYDAKVAEKPTIKAGESTASFIERKKAYNEELGRLEQELRMQQALMDEIAKIQNTATEETAVEEAPVAEEVLEDNGIGVEAIGLDESAATGEDVRFSATEARELLDAMQAGAEILVPRMLTEDIWKNEIEGRFFTSPIGEVKFGENQYDKNVGKERSREFGMLIPTIKRPDLIFEEYDPKEGSERQTKYVFVKTFLDEAGEKHINYASVSVRQEGMEVVTSSHRLRDKQVLNKIEKEQMLWNRFASDSTSSAQGGSTDQSNALSDSKDSKNLETPSESARFSVITPQMDADYLAAVERGDMETAQRMVLEAAKLAMPNTAMIDRNGYPKIFYHNTDAEFTAFGAEYNGTATDAGWLGDGFYFYGDPAEGDLYGRNKMKVFLNIEEPYNATSEENNFLAEANSRKESIAFSERLKEEWYDGVYYNGDLRQEAVAFYPSQIKSAEAVTYDDAGDVIPLSERFNPENEDIRFSTVRIDPNANQQAEGNVMFSTRRGSLVGMHNISEDKLRKAIKQGGLANPSTAVVNISEYLLDEYGEISLIMPSSLVDANTGDNVGTYTGDAWTPTYPPISRKVDDRGWKIIKDRIRAAIGEESELYSDIVHGVDNYLDDNRSSKMEFVFLKEKGIEPEIAYKGADGFVGMRNLEAILGVQGLRDGLESYERYKNASPMAKRSFNMWLDAAGNKQAHRELKEQLKKEPKLKLNEDVSFADFDSFTYDIFRKEQDAGKIDTYDTMSAAARYVDANNLRGEFEAWLESLMGQAGAKEVFFAGYTRSGERIYKDNTLENVSRHMRLQGRTNVYNDHGLSASQSALLQRLTSLSQIRKNKGRLQNEATYNKEHDALKDRLWSIISQLADMQEISSNQFMNVDYAESRLQDAFTKRDPIAYLNKEYGYDIDPAGEYADEINSFIKDAQQMPAKYFETKFERPVYLNEFAAAVMPTTASEDVKQAVSEAGLPIFEYDSAVEGSRHEATLKATDMDSIRFSIANENQAIFVSNAARAVEAIKMEKATPAQWLAMIEKSGGLKAGEDKWMGLSDWLNESDKKTLTKQEVLDFINENMIVIEEEKYGEVELSALQEEFNEIYDNIIDNMGNEDESNLQLWEVVMNPMGRAWEELRDRYSGGDDFDMAFSYDSHGNIEVNDPDAAGHFLGVKPIDKIRLDFTTNGLLNNQEIALVVPTIESWNETDEVHFGDAGEGRAVAWIRFGETTDYDYGRANAARDRLSTIYGNLHAKYGDGWRSQASSHEIQECKTAELEFDRWKNGRKVLVIDEIQSKRHQEGRESGYRVRDIEQWLNDNNVEAVESGEFYEFIKNGETDRRFSKGLMNYDVEKAKKLYVSGYNKSDIPDAPFDKNWHELAMKRMLRYAAENGYDVIAWTKGDQQAQRYHIGDVVASVDYRLNDDGTYHVDTMSKLGYQIESIPTTFNSEQELAEVFGKEIARKITSNLEENKKTIAEAIQEKKDIRDWRRSQGIDQDSPEYEEVLDKYAAADEKLSRARKGYTLSEIDFRIGGEGMKGFYDKMLPAFMNKYGKKWGIKVEDITLPNVEEAGRVMHSVPVTEEMKASVMEGQVMFSAVQIDPAVRQEMDTIKAKAMWNGTFMKAPNGADTMLTEDQWLMVRTKNFINWFGDWINDPENASKVVDENGEPRVVYHGGSSTFTKFDTSLGDGMTDLGQGSYFSSNEEVAREYTVPNGDNQWQIDNYIEEHPYLRELSRTQLGLAEAERIAIDEVFKNAKLYPVFLNLRNPYLTKMEDFRNGDFVYLYNRKGLRGYDGIIDNTFKERFEDFARGAVQYVAFEPSQIKSATETTGLFSESGDIRYSSRFDVNTNPTEAQKKAGNYKMGHLRLDGYNITIENPKGFVRRGTDSKGNEWENTLNNDYGYIRGTEGVDGDHIDVYLSDNPAEGNVFVIDQVNPETREFDEHKVMYGFNSMDEAREAYLANFSEGWNGLGTITEVTKDEFRKWIDSSHRKTKPFSEYKSVKTDILDEGDIRYSVVTDPALLERLDGEPTIKLYRAMQLIDGKLYPPMSAKVDGKMREPIELGKWEQAEERPDLADEKGYFKLDKGNKTSLKARYNPYFHTSPTPLNDQFSSAQTRPELVTVEVEVPESELTSGYKAEKAKDSVGQMEWKAGVVQGKLSGTRTVILSRWDKPIRIVPDSEVADKIVEMFDGKDITMPSNVVTPSLRAELESRGVPFVETDNKGKPVETGTTYSALSTPTDEIVAEGMKFSIQDFARLAGNIFQDMPESFRKEAIEETFKRGWDMQSAIFQIPARLAEKENWDESDKELAKVIREKVQDAMDESGVVMSRPLTTKEALWMLYRSTEANGDSMLDAAKRSIVAHNLGFDSRSMALKKAADDIIRYSVVRNRQIDAATDMYNYEANLWTSRLAESWLDMNQSVIALQNALADASGKPIESWEDVVLALNQLSSKSYADKKKYMRNYLEPLWKNVRDKVKRSGLSVEQIERYMMLKHGLERNKKFAMRDAKQFYREMYDKVADRMKNTSHAEQVVALSEANKRIADIDAQIATASGKKLKNLQEARERAVVEKEIAELVLRGDEQQNADDLQMYYNDIEAGTNPKYAEFREKDYGGLTSMFMDQIADVRRKDYKTEEAYQAALLASVRPRFDKVADMEAAAQIEVDSYENRAYMPTLWDAVNAATKEILRHQHASGMITTEQYDAVRNMFDFYVPLRGFADNTAEDMYSYYMNNSAGGFAKPIIAAKGRKTRAESPLGWIGAMAESAIQQDNKNEAKMKLYYALMNRPDTGVLSLTEMWYEFSHKDPATGKKVFVPAYPPATGRALSADDMRQHMDAWEQSMKAKQAVGEAYKKSQGVNLGGSVIFQDKAQDAEHIIRVKVAGKDYAILVNGNPRAAQAINGLLNPDANVGPVRQWYGELRRGMSALMTSFSPLFWVANYQRDLLSSFMRTSESEGWKQAFKYLGNRFHGWKAAKYIYKYDNGKMGNSYYDTLYKEFAENGGITGYTFLTTNKEYEKLLEDYIKNEGKEFRNWVKGVWDKFMGFGEAIEQVSRFAAYITARESGKSIEQSVAAAKEVSVNFNRKGSAKPISLDELERLRDKNGKPLNAPKKAMAIVFSAMPLALKELYFFFNASIQALSSSAKLARKSPGKAMAWAGMYMGLSVGLAFLNYLLAGDDDDNDYLDLPDYLRHSTALFKMGDNYYFKWSLPQEMRPFYASADILVSKIMGKTPHKTAWATAGDIALATAEWLPVNPFGTDDPILALVPDAFAPLAEIKANQNSFGGKIYDDMSYRSEEVVKNIPAYRKGTSKTGKIYVDMAEFLNDISGGDEVQKGAINLNPAIVEHLVEGYGGGIYDFGKMIIGIPRLIDEAMWGEGVEVRDIPFVNKVLLSTDETNMYSHTNDAFNYYRGVSDNAQRIEKEYFTSDNPARAEAYRQEDDWRIHLLYKQYEEDFKDFRKQLDEAVDETEISLLREQQNAVREQLLNDIANGVLPDPLFEAKIDMDRKFDELSALRKAVAEAAKRDDTDAAEQAQKDLEQFVESEDFRRYAELRPYVKTYEKLRKATKEAGSAETRQELEEATASAKKALDEKLKEF